MSLATVSDRCRAAVSASLGDAQDARRRSTLSITARRGSLLVVTLWLIIILSMLAVAISHRLSLELQIVKYRVAQAKARALAQGAVRAGMLVLQVDAKEGEPPEGKLYDWLGDDWAVAPGTDSTDSNAATLKLDLESPDGGAPAGRIELRIVDEHSKISINRVDDGTPVALTIVRALLGDQTAANLITDYVDNDNVDGEDPPLPGSIESSTNPPYQAKDAPIARIEELFQIPGLTPEIIAKLQRYASPFLGKQDGVNINTAPLPVLQALFAEDTGQLAERIDTFRRGSGRPEDQGRIVNVDPAGHEPWTDACDPCEDLGRAKGAMSTWLTTASNRFTIEGLGRTPDGAEVVVHAVVDRTQPLEKMVLAWWEG